MSIPDEMLMAYVDGELDATTRAQVESAIAADPELARRAEKHAALRKNLGGAYDRVLLETVPDRLIASVLSSPTTAAATDGQAPSTTDATVTDINSVRAARAAKATAAVEPVRAAWSWVQWGAVAASLVVGAIFGHLALRSPDLSPVTSRGGQLVAQGNLEQALWNQLASSQASTAPVQIGVSFKTKAGEYCRTFSLQQESALGGLACRARDAWQVRTLALADAGSTANGGYKPAGSDMPAAVRAAVEEQIAGDPLDAQAEAQAQKRDWK